MKDKKSSSFLIIILVIFILGVGGYIAYNKMAEKEDSDITNFNETEEILLLDNKLSEIGSSLGWIAIVSGFNNSNEDGTYSLSRNTDLIKDIGMRQLFVMEYILTYSNNSDKFIILDQEENKLEDSNPTDETTIAYLKYDDFNEYYKELFGKDFDLSKGMKGNTSYDDAYVYYYNRRPGSNGVYVSMITTDSISYKNGEYTADVKITYSTRAAERVGKKEDNAVLKYSKKNDTVILKSFGLK